MGIPRFGSAQVKLLERLSNACSVSGDEGEVRKIILQELRPLTEDLRVDYMGNVLAVRPGDGEARLRVMLAAHMDEVGFMLVQAEDRDEGIYRFDTVGGPVVSYLAGQPVWIGKDRTPGVIGAKPVHLTTGDEVKTPYPSIACVLTSGPATAIASRLGIGPPLLHNLLGSDRASAVKPWTTGWVWQHSSN